MLTAVDAGSDQRLVRPALITHALVAFPVVSFGQSESLLTHNAVKGKSEFPVVDVEMKREQVVSYSVTSTGAPRNASGRHRRRSASEAGEVRG